MKRIADVMEITSLGVSSDARINRQTLAARFQAAGLPNLNRIGGKNPVEGLLGLRSDSDAIRKGVQKVLTGFGSFVLNEVKHTVVSAPAKGPVGHLILDFHLKQQDEKVKYQEVGTLKFIPPGKNQNGELSFTEGEAFHLVPVDLQAKLRTAYNSLLIYGKENLFDDDLRGLNDSLCAGFVKYRSSTWLLIKPEQVELTAKIAKAFGQFEQGEAKWYPLQLICNQGNASNVLSTLEADHVKRMEAILEDLAKKPETFKACGELACGLQASADQVCEVFQYAFPDKFYELFSEVHDKVRELEEAHENAKAERKAERQASRV